MISSQDQRLEPEFAGHALPFHMNMNRLVAIEAIEIEPILSGNIFDRRHGRPWLQQQLNCHGTTTPMPAQSDRDAPGDEVRDGEFV
jgi:hypothetical protein